MFKRKISRAKRKLNEKFKALNANEVSAKIKKERGFIQTKEWRALRLTVIEKYGCRCMKCGKVPKHMRSVNVDHIKPRLHFPELSLVFDNLQVLCSQCNKAKGNKHCTDYRPASGEQTGCADGIAASGCAGVF